MDTAIICGLIILTVLILLLLAGVPIAAALGISSICAILPVMDADAAVLTGAQRIFSGISVFSLLDIPQTNRGFFWDEEAFDGKRVYDLF